MSFISSLKDTATELISEFGTSGKFVSERGTMSMKIAFTSGTKSNVPDTYIGQYERVAFMTDTGKKPMPGDQVIVGKDAWVIVNADNYSPDNVTNAAYRLLLRS